MRIFLYVSDIFNINEQKKNWGGFTCLSAYRIIKYSIMKETKMSTLWFLRIVNVEKSFFRCYLYTTLVLTIWRYLFYHKILKILVIKIILKKQNKHIACIGEVVCMRWRTSYADTALKVQSSLKCKKQNKSEQVCRNSKTVVFN